MIRIVLAAFGILCAAPGLWGAEAVTFRSLVAEMADVDALARWPAPEYRLLQQSSYDRASKTPDDPQGWFANKDMGQFLRIDTQGGRKEYVLMDYEGPGALVRFWMPDKRTMPPFPPVNTKIRIYLDGSNVPAIEGHMLDLFNGTSLVPPPFGHKSLASSVSYLPIPFARACKITLDEPPLYYAFTFRAYPRGTRVRTFSIKELERERAVVERVGRILLAGPPEPRGHTVGIRRSLAPGGQSSADLPASGGAVREISLKLGSYQDPQVTRSLVLAIDFDGQQTVWVPVGAFFGTGIGLNPFRTFHRIVAEDGTMTARWVMPYRKSGRITLINYGKNEVQADLSARAGTYRWDARSMYFHASWRHQYPLHTRPNSDWNYVQVHGKGVYAGDTLTVMNPVAGWWGEGDEKIWVDGDKFPSLFGTGTEDYYGYSWGGRNRAFYEHPFHAQVRVQHYNKMNPERPPLVGDTRGFSTETRTRQLDRLPFQSDLKFDMEVWRAQDLEMEYSAGTYWYAFPGATSNRKPQPEEAARPLPQF